MRFTAAMADGTAFVIFGSPEASRLEVGEVGTRGQGRPELRLRRERGRHGPVRRRRAPRRASWSSTSAAADGFIADILAGVRVESDFGAGSASPPTRVCSSRAAPRWRSSSPRTSSSGRSDRGAHARRRPRGRGVPARVGANVRAQLGPLDAVVEEIGVDRAAHVPAGPRPGQPRPARLPARLQAAATASACASTPASSPAVATSSSTPTTRSTPARSSLSFAGIVADQGHRPDHHQACPTAPRASRC